ncbi:MAG: alpha/beta hydrolase [Tannerella sp.]|nr:alpha/beta hydrolase [Tannerella sp.]
MLIKKTALLKRLAERSAMGGKRGRTTGRELFLDTEAGRVRALGYRMECPERLPLFINIHGGGFILGCPEMDDAYMMNVAEKANVKILNVEYSLAPQFPFPAAVNECYSVVKYAQHHSEELGIDSDRIAVGGHSAGGNITAAICIKNADTGELHICCAILDYPPLDIYTDSALKPRGKGLVARLFLTHRMSRIFDASYCIRKEERKNPLISPVYASREQLAAFPPTLILTAGKDSLCAEGERFRDLLIEAGVDVTHRRFEKSPHGFTLSNSVDAKEGWLMMIHHLKRWTSFAPKSNE